MLPINTTKMSNIIEDQTPDRKGRRITHKIGSGGSPNY